MITADRPGATVALLCVAACLSAWGARDAQAQESVESVSPSSGVGYLGLSWSLGGFSLALVANDSTPRRTSYPVVMGVAECSPAEAAGLRVDDVIEEVDGRDARLFPLFGDAANGPGTVHQLLLRRNGKLVETTITRTKQLSEHESPSDRCGAAR